MRGRRRIVEELYVAEEENALPRHQHIVEEHDAVHLLEARAERVIEMRAALIEAVAAEELEPRGAAWNGKRQRVRAVPLGIHADAGRIDCDLVRERPERRENAGAAHDDPGIGLAHHAQRGILLEIVNAGSGAAALQVDQRVGEHEVVLADQLVIPAHVVAEGGPAAGEIIGGRGPGGIGDIHEIRRPAHHAAGGTRPVQHHVAAPDEVVVRARDDEREADGIAAGGRRVGHLGAQRRIVLHVVERRDRARPVGEAGMLGDVVHPLATHIDNALLGLEPLEVLATVACRHVVLLSAERGLFSFDNVPSAARGQAAVPVEPRRPPPLTSATSRPRLSGAGRRSFTRDTTARSAMYSYIARRLAFGALAVVGVSIVVFVVLRVLPGDPLVAIFGPEGFTKLSEAERARYMADLGLSAPLPVQYFHWVQDIIRGNLGHSFFRAESVADMISRRGPLTAEIALISVVLSWLVGIPVAVISVLRPNSLGDNVARFLSILFLAVPGFWFGMLIVLGLLLMFGYRAPLANVPLFEDPWANLQSVIGPAVVLGLGQAAYITRMARSSLLEVIREDYIRTARAKGLNRRVVVALHALPNALLPVITLSGILLGFVLAGSIPVERAFGTPGLGYAMAIAVSERDVFVMQNLVFLYAVVFVVLNIVVDLISAWLDPRIRYA